MGTRGRTRLVGLPLVVDLCVALGCAARVQGAHRLERGLVYHNYLRHYFGEEVTQRHVLRIVPRVGHSSSGIFNSPQGLEALFDVGGP